MVSCRGDKERMYKTLLVAEIGINHNGDMNVVRRLIEESAAAGFNYVKFQKRDVDLCVPQERRMEMKDTPWGRISYIDYKEILEDINYDEIDYICKQNYIQWFASPWDIPSLEYITRWDIPFIKVASAGNTDIELLQAVRDTGKDVIMSTGMTTAEQFYTAFSILHPNVTHILACTSSYPTPDSDINLKFIHTLQNQYLCNKIGFSSHSPGVIFPAASVLYGAKMIEIHITLDRAMFGSDQAASIEPAGMRKFVKYVRAFEEGMGDGTWKVYDSELPVIKNLRWRDEL